jgi:hypothetical protein
MTFDRDIKVIDTLRQLQAELAHGTPKYEYNPLAMFAEAVALTRMENGVPIQDIAKCFRYQFDAAELDALTKELQKGKL